MGRMIEDVNAGTPSVSQVCTKCGAKISVDTTQGSCPACILETGLGLRADELDTFNATRADRGKIPTNRTRPLAHFGDYELVEEIGHGGQGLVYRARQKSLNRTVALKVIGLGHWATEAHLKRFRLEAEAVAHLDDPRVVPIYEIGERDGACYFSMKFIEGQPLDKVIASQLPPARKAAELIAKVARTLHHAHQNGVLHRDVKPGNILIDTQGEPHLTDFGLARLVETDSTVTRTMEVLGTPSYMAPEQAAGKTNRFTASTDIYGLGAVLYQLLTGHPPFVGDTTYDVVRLVLETEPRPPRSLNPKVDRDLATICLKCLEKEPSRRYLTALTLAEDLERWLRHEPIRAQSTGALTRAKKWVQRNPTTATLAASLVALATAVGIMWWNGQSASPPPAGIAVLPFENLGDKENAVFVDGLQDDVLTKLAKIGDLKVISRTSVMQYRGVRNAREIGRALRVSHLLEGSVRKNGDKVHLNAQLIDVRTDTHVWAEQYDYALGDVFAIQSELTQKVAEQVHAKVSSAEKSMIERPPTADMMAFDLYNRAKNIFLAATNSNSGKEELLQAADLLNQALARDPSYFEAYCQLAGIHDLLYILGHDHTAGRLAVAEAAIEAALRLRPNAGEGHLARADNLYSGHLDYDAARTELELARKNLPNDSRVFELMGLVENRRGKREEGLRELEHAMELDPRNVYRLEQIGNTYWHLRRYSEAAAAYDRALAIEPHNPQLRISRANLDIAWKADTRAVHQVIDSIRATNPGAIRQMADSLMTCALADRDPAAARAALIAAGENTPLNDDAVHFNRPFVDGVIAKLEKDEVKAHAAFEAARMEQEKIVQAQPDYAPPLCVKGVIDSFLGRKEEALSESRRAVELLPVERDALNGPLMLQWYAISAAWVGEKDLALEQLNAVARVPGMISYGYLKLLPFWDPLRGDPRFEQILTEASKPISIK
jgi:TolB-like protein/Tfp pilus assembly protein PilF/predicted Ser/Thr protein kinase